MVLTIVSPVADVHVDAVAGFLDGDGECMPFSADKAEFLFQVEFPSVDGYGEQVVGHRDALRNDQSLELVVLAAQEGYRFFLRAGTDTPILQVHRSLAHSLVQPDTYVRGFYPFGGESVSRTDFDHRTAEKMVQRDAYRLFGGRNFHRLSPQEVAGFVIRLGALVGQRFHRQRLDVGRRTAVGIVSVEVGRSRFILPIDRCVRRPRSVVGESHVVHMVAVSKQRSGCTILVVHYIEADVIAGLKSRIGSPGRSCRDATAEVDGYFPDFGFRYVLRMFGRASCHRQCKHGCTQKSMIYFHTLKLNLLQK